jgi:hypothetical protein
VRELGARCGADQALRRLPMAEPGLFDRLAAVDTGEATPAQLAYLDDRVRMRQGRAQRYGTQIRTVDDRPVPFELEDPDGVDERRRAVGLEPLADYVAGFESTDGGT